MTVVKVIELIGSSKKSFEEAVGAAVKTASKSLRDITGADVISFNAKVEDGKVIEYRANVKLAFVYHSKDE